MPAFYPIMLRGFKLLEKKQMEAYISILRDYAVAPSFQNTIHYLARNNFPSYLHKELARDDL
jgi:hypothetical protein